MIKMMYFSFEDICILNLNKILRHDKFIVALSSDIGLDWGLIGFTIFNSEDYVRYIVEVGHVASFLGGAALVEGSSGILLLLGRNL